MWETFSLKVVKLRKDVKKVRVLIIRKLTRHIAKLKTKKGTEDAVLKNQRRAQRLLEEIHAMKRVKPDNVTKSALRDEINFEKVCKKPDSSIDDRAIARLATHPLLKKKIADLKAAVKAFKDARRKQSTVQQSGEPNSTKVSDQQEMAQNCSSDIQIESKQNDNKRAKVDAQRVISMDNKMPNMDIQDQKLLEKETTSTPDDISAQTIESQMPLQTETEEKEPAIQKQQKLTLSSRLETSKKTEGGSEDSDGEEQEYFDDSTEERFFKQSSGPDDSDSNDDFFIGRVRRTKKKKVDSNASSAQGKGDQMLKCLTNEVKHFDCRGMPSEEPENSKASGKAAKLESVFCSSLSVSKQKSISKQRTVSGHLPKNRKTASLQQCKPQITKQQPSKGPAVKQERRKEQPLHPSWEASKRRKEQLSQITVFQGKKITFADD
ncbi:serum response factor-binding protein 1 isoform X2 [Microcaecilia unicolor]|uniref:Serum response factor-binding protein 1 n=1 Tax=Microcaecilia unicolor TaxID=1415580 RepID=A0A6P7XA66_9AMPH|nr:serum response factor-binding protein 1 isoform X2 [Microcaecilia unicolor]